MGKGAIAKPLVRPVANLAGEVVETIGTRLLKRVAPDLLRVKPGMKFKSGSSNLLDFTRELSDETALRLLKHAESGDESAKFVRAALEEGSLGNTEPLNKYSQFFQLDTVDKIPPKTSTRPLRRDYPRSPEGRALARSDFQKWLDPELAKVGGNPKKVKRGAFAPEGVFFDGEKQGISGVTKYAQSGGEIPNFYNVGPLEQRAWQLSPESHPVIGQFFDEGHATYRATGGAEGVDPRLTFEDFKKYVTKTAGAADRLTEKLRKLWSAKTPSSGALANKGGIKVDGKQADIPRPWDLGKEHMVAAANRATDLGDSQVVGNQFYNQMMGKLDSFNKRLMDILNLPGGGGRRLMSGKEIQNPNVQLKVDQTAQQGWMKAVTDWVGARSFDADGNLVIDEDFLGVRLSDADKIRIQQAQFTHADVNKKGAFRTDITGQEQVAMKILAEKEISEAYFEAGLGSTDDELEVLWELLMDIGKKMQVNRAKFISNEGQLRRLAQKYPEKSAAELEKLLVEVEGVTVQTGKTTSKKQKAGSIKSKEGVVTKLPPEKPLSDQEFLATVAPGKQAAEKKSLKKYVKQKRKEIEIVETPTATKRKDEYMAGTAQLAMQEKRLDL